MSCKCIADKFKRRVEISVAGLDSWFFLFWGGGCKILWVLLAHLEAFLSKDFLVEEHTAKCVISDTSPVPSSTGLNLCFLSCIPLCRDTKKIMSYFSFISPHNPFSLMHQHISSNRFSLSVDIEHLWVFWKGGPSPCIVKRVWNWGFSNKFESGKHSPNQLNCDSFHWLQWASNQELDLHSLSLISLKNEFPR